MNYKFHVTHFSHKSNLINSLSQCYRFHDPNIRVFVCWLQVAICYLQRSCTISVGMEQYWAQTLNSGNPMQAYSFLQEKCLSGIYWPNWIQSFNQQFWHQCAKGCLHMQAHLLTKLLKSSILDLWIMLSHLKLSLIRHLVNTNSIAFTNQELLVAYLVSTGPRTSQTNSSRHFSCLKCWWSLTLVFLVSLSMTFINMLKMLKDMC